LNKLDFISLIEHPEKLGEQHVASLKKMAIDFPYFQISHLLLTKALHNESHYEYEKQLKYTAVMVPDRAILYRFVQQTTLQTEPLATIDESTNIEDPSHIESEQENTKTPIKGTIINEHVAIDNIKIETVLANADNVKFEKPVIIEEVVLLQNEVKPIETTERKAETIINIIDKSSLAQIKDENEKHSFSEWLNLKKQNIQNYKTVVEKPVNKVKETDNLTTTNQNIQQEIAQQVERSNINEFESVLDKFIRENPRISRGKAEFYNPVNKAKQSVEEDDDLVTETLATVYYKQGNFKKAIRAYEKLCLIYPHKMTYFASLIQKIKTENKD